MPFSRRKSKWLLFEVFSPPKERIYIKATPKKPSRTFNKRLNFGGASLT